MYQEQRVLEVNMLLAISCAHFAPQLAVSTLNFALATLAMWRLKRERCSATPNKWLVICFISTSPKVVETHILTRQSCTPRKASAVVFSLPTEAQY